MPKSKRGADARSSMRSPADQLTILQEAFAEVSNRPRTAANLAAVRTLALAAAFAAEHVTANG